MKRLARRFGADLDEDTRLMTVKQFFTWAKRDKSNLIEYIMSLLDTYPKRKLARLAYTLTKATLPRLSIRKRKELKRIYASPIPRTITRIEKMRDPYGLRRKPKRKFSRKQLAAQRLFAKRARAGTLKRRRR